MQTKILNCSCDHPWQDKRYGPGKRAHNWAPGQKQADRQRFRCTVCALTRGGPEIPRTH